MKPSRWSFVLVALASATMLYGADPDPKMPQTGEPPKTAAAPKFPLPQGVLAERDIEYAKEGGKPLRLDIYRAEDQSGKQPLVVWIHGGGWSKGSKEDSPATFLAAKGYAVASIQYRLTNVARWPAQIDDCRAAIRWLRKNADDYGIDPERIGVWGASAGGQLVSMLGTTPPPTNEPGSSRVSAVCDFFGPTDMLTQPANVPGPGKTDKELAESNAAKLLGGILRDIPDKAKAASPLYQVSSDDAPFLIVHGSKDERVPLDQSERFYSKLKDAGVPAELFVIEGAGHGGAAFMTAEVRRKVQQFFDRYLKSAPE